LDEKLCLGLKFIGRDGSELAIEISSVPEHRAAKSAKCFDIFGAKLNEIFRTK